MTDRETLAVERQTCPLCVAKPGQPCTTSSAMTVRTIPHEQRLKLAHIARDVWSVDCDKCGAKAGRWCVSAAGFATAYHTSRKRTAGNG